MMRHVAWGKRQPVSAFALLVLLLAFSVLLTVPCGADALTDEQFEKQIDLCAQRCEEDPAGGIALMGSSSFARWTTAPEDFERLSKGQRWAVTANLIYNFGVAGSTSRQWTMESYLDDIVAKRPTVVAVYGTNRLGAQPLNGNLSTHLVHSSIKQLSSAIDYIRATSKEQAGYSPAFVLVSGVKTPNAYRRSKHITLKQDIADSDGGYCVAWNRIDMYNTELQKLSMKYPEVYYCDIEDFYYKVEKGTLEYRLDVDNEAAGSVSAVDLISGKVRSPYLANDLLHPTKKAYNQIWERVVKQTGTQRIRMCQLYDVSEQGYTIEQ